MALPFVGEYKRYHRLLERALEQVTDEEFFQVLTPGTNSIAIIINHLSGNFTSRFTDFLTSDGEKPWRNRESEFDVTGLSREEVMARWESAWQVLTSSVWELGDDDRLKTITIRGVTLTVDEALTRSLSHFSYHVGEVVGIARQLRGPNWQFLSIAPGGSEAYNANPTSEKLT